MNACMHACMYIYMDIVCVNVYKYAYMHICVYYLYTAAAPAYIDRESERARERVNVARMDTRPRADGA